MQKNQEKRRPAAPEQEEADEPQFDPLEEIKRQMRELAGDRQPESSSQPTPVPRQTPTIAPTPAPRRAEPIRRSVIVSKPAEKVTIPESKRATVLRTAQQVTARPAPRLQAATPNTAGSGKVRSAVSAATATATATAKSSKSASEGRDNLSRIVDEFDIERAVIYSAILNPKFEEN